MNKGTLPISNYDRQLLRPDSVIEYAPNGLRLSPLISRKDWIDHPMFRKGSQKWIVAAIAEEPTVRLLYGPYTVSVDKAVFRSTKSFHFAI